MRDLHNNEKAVRVISPVAIGTTGVGQTGKVIDLQGYNGVEFHIAYGSITATNAVFTPTLMEGNATGALTSVADADMLGLEVNAGIGQTTPRTSGVSKNVVKRIGYIGAKRYVSLNLKSTATAATLIAVTANLGKPVNAPLAT